MGAVVEALGAREAELVGRWQQLTFGHYLAARAARTLRALVDCDHDYEQEPLAHGRDGETRCTNCGVEFLMCPGCSEESTLNHAPAIYHAEPLCPRRYTQEEYERRYQASLRD